MRVAACQRQPINPPHPYADVRIAALPNVVAICDLKFSVLPLGTFSKVTTCDLRLSLVLRVFAPLREPQLLSPSVPIRVIRG